MSRLPQPGNDSGVWGDILNDYLSQSLASDGTVKPGTIGASQLKPQAVTATAIADDTITTEKLRDSSITIDKIANANGANGIALLDADGKLPEAQVPSRLSESQITDTINDAISQIPSSGSGADATLTSGPDIACFGDSLTAGTGGNGTTYPSVLGSLVTANGYLGTVRNIGVGGESSRGITARQGGRPVLVTVPSGSIPASGGVVVTLAYDDGVAATLLAGGGAGVNPVVIAGVTGTLTLSTDTYTFTRSSSGAVVQVPFLVPLITEASRDRTNDTQIYWMGQNDGTSDASLIIGREQAAIEHMTSAVKNWLVIGLSTDTAANRAAMETQFLTAFGRRFVNIREWLSSSAAMAAAGLTPTADDITAMGQGAVPPSLKFDMVHLNPAGYTLVANYVFARLVELGMLQTAPAPDLPAAHSAGVDGWDHRYIASDLEVGTVTTWIDRGAVPLPLKNPTGTVQRIDDSGTSYVSFTAAELGSSAQLTDDTVSAPNARTVALVMRNTQGTAAGQPIFVTHNGISLKRLSNGTFASSGVGTPVISLAGASIGTWRIVIFEITAPVLRVDAAEVTTASGWVPTASTTTTIGVSAATAGGGTRTVDYAEMIEWPKLLDATERNTVVAALQDHYSVV